MPSFSQALQSDPKQFSDFGGEVGEAASNVQRTNTAYNQTKGALQSSWQGKAFDKFEQAARNLTNSMGQTKTQLSTVATAAQTGGQMMAATVQALKQTEQSAKSAGFRVTPMPLVMIGQQHIQQAQAAAPYGTAPIIAAYTAAAAGLTSVLVTTLTTLTMQDTGVAATINTAGLLTRQLGVVMGGGNKALLPARKVAHDPYARPGFRSQTKNDAWDRSREASGERQDEAGVPRDGKAYDPRDEAFAVPLTRQNADVGHPPGWEFRDQAAAARLWGVDRTDFLDDYNHPDFIMEGRKQNRSHQFESDGNTTSDWVSYYYDKYGSPPTPQVPNVDYSDLRTGNLKP